MKIPYSLLLTVLTDHFAAKKKKRPNEDTVFELEIPEGAHIRLAAAEGCDPGWATFPTGLEFTATKAEPEPVDEDEQLIRDYAELTKTAPLSPAQAAVKLEASVLVVAHALNLYGEKYLAIVGEVEEKGKMRKLWMAKGTEAHAVAVAAREATEAEKAKVLGGQVARFRLLFLNALRISQLSSYYLFIRIEGYLLKDEDRAEFLKCKMALLQALLQDETLFRDDRGFISIHENFFTRTVAATA